MHNLQKKNFAVYAVETSGLHERKYKEAPHPFRTPFQRDIARIIHSRPFRRLEYKTQVFLNGTGDHYRTRLTHTIEVSITARTIARSLNLNEDLTEAIALAHDLGHTPFGHVGENALNNLLTPLGRNFEHNKHSLRIVDELVLKYPGFSGLNLTWHTRTGLLKHRETNQKLDGKVLPINLSLEAQVADLADDLTYYVHDIDDGLTSKLITLNELNKLEIWNEVKKEISKKDVTESSKRFVEYSVRTLVDLMVTDALKHSKTMLQKYKIKTPESAQVISEKIISFSPYMEKISIDLKKFLYSSLYRNEALHTINSKAEQIISDLFELYSRKPDLMGTSANEQLKSGSNLHTVITDYIAGMTDRYATEEHKKHFTSI